MPWVSRQGRAGGEMKPHGMLYAVCCMLYAVCPSHLTGPYCQLRMEASILWKSQNHVAWAWGTGSTGTLRHGDIGTFPCEHTGMDPSRLPSGTCRARNSYCIMGESLLLLQPDSF